MDFDLDDAKKQNFDIAYKRIEAQAFAGKTPVSQPKVVFVVAQPGAGKSTMSRLVADKEFLDGNYVQIDTDQYRSEHPQSAEFKQMDDKLYGGLTHEFANSTSTRLLTQALERGFNVLVEKTFADPDKAAKLCQQVKEQNVELAVYAKVVPNCVSSLRMYSRYEADKLEKGYGRLPPQEYADKCFENLPKSLNLIEDLKLADRLILLDDQCKPVHVGELDKGNYSQVDVDKSFKEVAAPNLTAEQTLQHHQDWAAKVFASMEERQAPKAEIKQVKAVAMRLSNDIRPEAPGLGSEKAEPPAARPVIEIELESGTKLSALKEISVLVKTHGLRINPTDANKVSTWLTSKDSMPEKNLPIEKARIYSPGTDSDQERVEIKGQGVRIAVSKEASLSFLKDISVFTKTNGLSVSPTDLPKLTAWLMDKSPAPSTEPKPPSISEPTIEPPGFDLPGL